MAAPKGKLWVQAQLGLPPLLLLTMALAGGSGTAAAEAFDSVLGDTASCHRACQLTYPLHTYPKVSRARLCRAPLIPRCPSRGVPPRCRPEDPGGECALRLPSTLLGVAAVCLPGPACTQVLELPEVCAAGLRDRLEGDTKMRNGRARGSLRRHRGGSRLLG